MKQKRRGMLKQILALGVIMVVVATSLNLALTLVVRRQILNQKTSDQESYAGVYSSSVDNIFENLISTVSYIQNAQAAQNLLSLNVRPTLGYIGVQENVFRLLSMFTTTSGQINEALIYKSDAEFLYTNSGITKPEIYHGNRFNGSFEEWMSVISGDYPSPAVLDLRGNGAVAKGYPLSPYYFIKTIADVRGKRCNVILALDDVFAAGTGHGGADFRGIYILDSQNRVLASNTDEPLPELASTRREGAQAGADGLFSMRDSVIKGLRYAIYTPYSTLEGGMDGVFALSILLTLVGMAALILAAVRISSRVYRPVRDTVDALCALDGGAAPMAGANELEDIRSRFVELVRRNQVLATRLDDSSPMLLEMLLFKLIMGSQSVNEVLLESDSFNIGFSEGFYNTFVIRMDLRSSSEELFFMKYKDVFNEIILTHTARHTLQIVHTRQDEATVVTYYKELAEAAGVIESYRAVYAELMEKIPESQFYIGCSECTNEIGKLHRCYNQAIRFIRHRGVDSNEPVISGDTGSEARESYLPGDFERELREMLDSQQANAAQKYISYILERNRKNGVSMSAYLKVCITINDFLVRFYRGPAPAESALIILHHDDYLYSVEHILEIVFTNLELVCQLPEKRETGLPVIERIEQYVGEHFTEDINLSTVAQSLGYTPNYISKFFKQEKGVNFTDYLNRKRIEFAKGQLAGKASIKQIAQRSGFSSSTIFIRTFEKYEGISPGEYRRTSGV